MSLNQVCSMEKKLNEGLTVLLKVSMFFFIDWKIFQAIPQGPGNTDELRSSTFWGWKRLSASGTILFEALQIHLLGMNIPKKSCSNPKLAFSLGRFPAITSWFLGAYKLQCPAYLRIFFVCSEGQSQQKKTFRPLICLKHIKICFGTCTVQCLPS